MRARISVAIVPLLLVFAVSAARDELAEIQPWMPIARGDQWVYPIEKQWGDRSRPETQHIEEEVEIIDSSIQHPGFTAIGRITRANRRELSSMMLVKDGCIYSLHILGPARPDDLPDVCFPLHEGATWGNAAQFREQWTVAGHGRKNPDDPASIEPSDWRLEAHLASGDDNYVWFRKGVGLVAERTWHNGTYDDQTARLIRFSGK
jgi:hypothetical protein